MLGTQDILLLGVIVVVLFGASKLPQLGKGLGEAIGNFKKAVREPEEESPAGKQSTKKEEISDKENQ